MGRARRGRAPTNATGEKGARLPVVPAWALGLLLLVVASALLLSGCTPVEDTPSGTDADTSNGGTSATSPSDGAGNGDGAPGATTTSSPGQPGTGVVTQTRELAPPDGPFSVCADCHAYLDVPGQVPPTLMENFSHVNHLERQATCDSCHEPPVHTEEGIRRPTMARCFTCHSQAEDARAPGECEYCHPADFPRIPPSHTPAFFQGGHAQVVDLQGPDDCLICHEGTEDTFCRDCHGVEIPHPAGWVRTNEGLPGEHVNGAYEQGESCARCHDNRIEPPGNCYGGECHGS